MCSAESAAMSFAFIPRELVELGRIWQLKNENDDLCVKRDFAEIDGEWLSWGRISSTNHHE